jgi:hypothetical protein
MTKMLFFPLRMLGWASAGFALGVGWKLGSYLVNSVMQYDLWQKCMEPSDAPVSDAAEPLWKRKFTKLS